MISSHEKQQLGHKINEIHKIILEEYRTNDGVDTCPIQSKQYFKQGPSSNMQIKDPKTIIIEEYYGSLHYLHTYWGKINLVGSTSSKGFKPQKILMDKLKQKLGLIIVEEGEYEGGSSLIDGVKIPNRSDHLGFFGPYYQVTKLSDKKLECPILKNRKHCYKTDKLTYSECNKDFQKYCLE